MPIALSLVLTLMPANLACMAPGAWSALTVARRHPLAIAPAPNPVLRTIKTGLDFPRSLAVDAKDNLAFVGGYTSTNVLDLGTGRIVRTLPTAGLIAVDDATTRVFIARGNSASPNGNGTLSIFDAKTGALISTHGIGVNPATMAIATLAGHIFILNTEDNQPASVSVISAATGTVVRTVRLGMSLPSGSFGTIAAPPPIVVAGRVPRAFVTDTHSVYMLDARSGAVLRTLPALNATLALDARADQLFVLSNPGTGILTVSILNATTGKTLHTFRVTIKQFDFHVKVDAAVVNQQAHRLFIAREGGYNACTILVVDTGSGRILSTVNENYVPVSMALDAYLNRVFVSHQNLWNVTDNTPRSAGSVSVLNATSGATIRTVQVGWLPWAMTLDPASGRLFVLNGWGDSSSQEGTLSVLSARALSTK